MIFIVYGFENPAYKIPTELTGTSLLEAGTLWK
jgi:hypothetical protein